MLRLVAGGGGDAAEADREKLAGRRSVAASPGQSRRMMIQSAAAAPIITFPERADRCSQALFSFKFSIVHSTLQSKALRSTFACLVSPLKSMGCAIEWC